MTVKPTKPEPKPAAASKEPAEFPLSLNDFCAQLSATDKRVELIAGFHASERAARRTKDLASSYSSRFTAFAGSPA